MFLFGILGNMKSDRKQKTVDYYDNEASTWASAHGRDEGESFWKDQMQIFHEILPSGKILEIGSGGGKDAAALMALGYDYIGTDASKGLIEIAQNHNPTAKFINMTVEDLDFPDNSFDGFWAAAVLLHIPKTDIDNALQSIKKQVRNSGVGFITLKEGDGEREDEKTGRWFSYYHKDEFKEILVRNDFKIIKFDKKIDGRGDRPDWLMFFVEKPIK